MLHRILALCLAALAAFAADPAPTATAAVRAEVAQAIADRDKAVADCDAATDAAIERWLKRVDLALLPVPKVGPDPRASEAAHLDLVKRINRALAEVADRRDTKATNRTRDLRALFRDEAKLGLVEQAERIRRGDTP